jgi:Zn-dependent protease with chaperone function
METIKKWLDAHPNFSLLGFVRLVGTGLLFLFVGSRAWSKSESAGWFQLLFGALVIGFVILAIGYWENAWWAQWWIPVLTVVALFIAEGIGRQAGRGKQKTQ